MGKRKSIIPGLSFSWNRALGVTKAKQNFAQKSGMQRKIGKAVTDGGCSCCLLAFILMGGVLVFLVFLFCCL